MNTVSFVFQNSRLIKGTILDNVKMARPNATKEEVLSAIHKAQCDEIIKKFPDGINTVIGTLAHTFQAANNRGSALQEQSSKMHQFSSLMRQPLCRSR